jgi:CRP-like cAMP-binding protein
MTNRELTPATNGAGDLDLDRRIITELRDRIEAHQARAATLRLEAAELIEESKRYTRALEAIIGKPPGRRRKAGARVRSEPSKLSPERVAEVREAILAFARDNDEFRQVDIRAKSGHTSGVLSLAFELLRQEGTIRLARQVPGEGKYFRLTRAAQRQGLAETAQS